MHINTSVVPIIGSAIGNSRLLANFVTIGIVDSKATISAYQHQIIFIHSAHN